MDTPVKPRHALLCLPMALAACVSTLEEMRSGPPLMVASVPGTAGRANECIARYFEGTRFEFGGAPFRVTARVVDDLGSISVERLDSPGLVTWLVESRAAGAAAQVAAWSQYIVHGDEQAVMGVHMRTAVERCGGKVVTSSLSQPPGRETSPGGVPQAR
jgi:hypothetical protein